MFRRLIKANLRLYMKYLLNKFWRFADRVAYQYI